MFYGLKRSPNKRWMIQKRYDGTGMETKSIQRRLGWFALYSHGRNRNIDPVDRPENWERKRV